MEVRPQFAAVLAGLLYASLSVFQGLAAAEPEAPSISAAVAPGDRATADAPSTDASPPAANAPAGQRRSDTTVVQLPVIESVTVSTATTTQSATTAQPAASDDDAIVCKKIEVFGSRVRKGQLCRTKREWQMETEAAKDFTKGVSKGNSTQPQDPLAAGG